MNTHKTVRILKSNRHNSKAMP